LQTPQLGLDRPSWLASLEIWSYVVDRRQAGVPVPGVRAAEGVAGGKVDKSTAREIGVVSSPTT